MYRFLGRSLFALFLLSAFRGYSADRYVVQGSALGPQVGALFVTWTTDIFFFNTTATDAPIRLVGVSNGNFPSDLPSSFTIHANRSTSLSANGAVATWGPRNPTFQPLWVLHIDVPDGVLLDDVLFIGEELSGQAPLPLDHYTQGKIRLPVFNELTPANQAQIHLATFLGDFNSIPSRANVTIYNGGNVTAQAKIEIREHCDDAVLLTTTIAIPSNTIIQTSGLNAPAGHCGFDFGFTPPPSAIYTVVTVDQPSLSFVSSLSNRDVPLTSISISQ